MDARGRPARRGGGAWAAIYAVATFFALCAALPFAWMIRTIFKQDSDLYQVRNNPFLYNAPPTWDNIDLLFTDTPYTTFVRNTLVVALLVVIITLLAAV